MPIKPPRTNSWPLGETWLEPEELCYPKGGGMTRRCLARHADGLLKVVKCGIPDTYFTIPTRCGFIHIVNDEFAHFERSK